MNNRLVMAPLTRNRATKGTDAPNDLNARYYRQRATAGLIVNADFPTGSRLYLDTAGDRIFIQLWHVGRVSHVSLQPGGGQPVAPSAIAAKTKTFIETGFADPPNSVP